MGMIRKAMSVTTIGLVDFRSDRERIARKAGVSARAAKKTNRLLAKQNRILRKK